MTYSCNKLWKLLIDKIIKTKDLKTATGIASSTIAKMSSEQAVSMDVLGRICQVLKCNIGDIVDVIY